MIQRPDGQGLDAEAHCCCPMTASVGLSPVDSKN